MKYKINHSNYSTLKQKQYYLGLSILKVLLAFDVIRTHNFKYTSTTNKFILFCMRNRRIHVPSFFIMSFYFMHNELIMLNFNKFIKRIERLLIPYLIWPITIWIINNIFNILFSSNFSSSFKSLKNQILWGNVFIIQFWFQWDLISLTILFNIFLFIFRRNYILIFNLLSLLSYILQYSGYNKKFYFKLRREKRQCLGRFNEVLPYAVTGFTLSSFKIINKLQNYKVNTLIFSLFIYVFIEKYDIFSKINGVAYAGVKLNISSICIILLFSLTLCENNLNKFIIKLLRHLTNYTAGVFYLHWTIITYLKKHLLIIKKGCFSGCVIIYLICYLISLFGMKLFGKTKLKNLFS